MVALLLGLIVGILVAAVCLLPSEAADGPWWPWALVLVLPLLVVLHPAVLRRIMLLVLRLTRQPVADVDIEAGALLRAAGWSLVMWATMGVQIWLLLEDLGGESDHAFILSVGAYAAAWVTGLLVVVAPAGAGAREAALVLVLTPAMGRPAALALAVTSRFLTIAGDGICALGVIGRRTTVAATSDTTAGRPTPAPQ